ncbi:SprB repeat-containing protein, partial [Flavobacterium sp. LB3P21]|uniref:SprB repeat-containing protein n=1 Tax=Flavobacterium sp. LB3P21 TaxID=3401719 RepID=UPI003AB00F00
FGGNNGAATASATGGTTSYSYSWNTSPVQTTATASGLIAGTYTVTVTDAKGCIDTETVTITEPAAALVATIGTPTNVSCFGGNNGAATASATGGTTSYSYSWNTSPVQTTATASGLIAGTYTVTVTDAKGCIDTESVTIIDGDGNPPVISQLPNETTINCPSIPQFATPTATDNVDTDVTLTYDDVETPGQCAGSYSITRTWTASDDCGNTSTKSQTINVQDTIAPTFTPPANITLSSGENCTTNTNPTITGNVTNINDTCDSNPTATYIDTECFGITETNGSINAGNGNYFPFTVSGFDDLSASNIQKIALSFETNQGKGRAEFTLVSPSGQGVILVGPYCSGGNCDDANSNTKELYLTTFYPNSSGYTQWNNANFIQDGINQNMTPNGGTTSPNTINGLTSYVSSFENLTGPMNGTWFIYSRKQASVNGSIDFNSVCLTPASSCTNNKVITRTWTVTDACGNFSKAIQTIKIQDTTAPVFVEALPENVTVQCSAVPTAATLTATDNCGDASVTYNQTSTPGLCAGAYTLTRTWTAKDACGLTTTHTQIVTVEDTTAPVFVEALPENVTVQCSA